MDQSLLDAHGCVHDAMLADNPGKGGWPRMSSQKTRCMHGWQELHLEEMFLFA